MKGIKLETYSFHGQEGFGLICLYYKRLNKIQTFNYLKYYFILLLYLVYIIVYYIDLML